MSSHSPDAPNLRRAHPLARALIARLESRQNARILEIGAGSGRNTAALRAAGFRVCSYSEQTRCAPPCDAALSTHALLHGTLSTLAAAVERIAHELKPDAPFYATFGSVSDARFGTGTRVDEWTFAPEAGDEKGVAHTYYDEERLQALLKRHFALESMEECPVDEIVGRWAHSEQPRGSVHWFVQATRLRFS